MGIKSFKPYSAGRRFMTVSTFEEITTDKPESTKADALKQEWNGRFFNLRKFSVTVK